MTVATQPTKLESCGSFEECSAPLCPMQPDTWARACWYPDEQVCISLKFRSLHWRKVQHRIQRKTKNHDDGYFTVAMLSEIKQVKTGIKGANPDGR